MMRTRPTSGRPSWAALTTVPQPSSTCRWSRSSTPLAWPCGLCGPPSGGSPGGHRCHDAHIVGVLGRCGFERLLMICESREMAVPLCLALRARSAWLGAEGSHRRRGCCTGDHVVSLVLRGASSPHAGLDAASDSANIGLRHALRRTPCGRPIATTSGGAAGRRRETLASSRQRLEDTVDSVPEGGRSWM